MATEERVAALHVTNAVLDPTDARRPGEGRTMSKNEAKRIPQHDHPQTISVAAPIDQQPGNDLAAIVNHPFVIKHQNDPTAAGRLRAIMEYHHDALDLKRLMGAAIAGEATPSDLRELIKNYLGSLP
jgi:hypothetical protein